MILFDTINYIDEINIKKSMPPKVNLQHTLNNPIDQQDWPNLQALQKMLHEYLQKCSKNRDYIQAQKAKQKISEVILNKAKRLTSNITKKYEQNYERLQNKHTQEKDNLIMEWNQKIQKANQNHTQSYQKRLKLYQQQLTKLREQLQIALPNNHSPDDRLKQLRYQQKRMAKQGNFIQAQKLKQEIQQRQIYLEQRHRQLRQNNIKQMMDQTQQKQQRDLEYRKRQWDRQIDDRIKDRNRKIKELEQKHQKQFKQLKWMYQQQVRMSGGVI